MFAGECLYGGITRFHHVNKGKLFLNMNPYTCSAITFIHITLLWIKNIEALKGVKMVHGLSQYIFCFHSSMNMDRSPKVLIAVVQHVMDIITSNKYHWQYGCNMTISNISAGDTPPPYKNLY